MRDLVLLRGLPASCKSTLIKNLGLEAYTLSTDDLRLKIGSFEQTQDGFCIPQSLNKKVFEYLYSLLEQRMIRGEFTIIDATHVNSKSCSEYRKLAEKYNYNIYFYTVTASLDECLERNSKRVYNKVPDSVIIDMYNRFSYDLGQDITEIKDLEQFLLETNIEKLKGYKGSIAVGDIHSSAAPLRTLLKIFNDDYKYIFLGDYFDRGMEPILTWKMLKELYKKPNVVMLLGNHEKHTLDYCNGEVVNSSSARETFTELEKYNITKEELRDFYNSLKEYYCFSIFNKNYFCCHGGLSFVPDRLRLTSLHTLTKGVGSYDTEIDEIYASNFEKGMCKDFIQVHGHRKTTSTDYSYCLEGAVELGGKLMFMGMKPNKVYVDGIRNKICVENKGYEINNDFINKVANTKGIYIKELKDNIISINFSTVIFENKIWNDLTLKARGLFVDKDTGKIVARSYDKFFNMGEMEETSPYNLEKNLVYPVKIREKANGFLGIVSLLDGRVKFFTKTTDSGEHTEYLRECWNLLSHNTKHELVNAMFKHNCSVVFEVIHHSDPHIVEYDKDCLYLLDFIENSIDTKFLDIKLTNKDKHLLLPKLYKTVTSYKDLVTSLEDINKHKSEGVVCRDANGFMFKYKTDWYNTWKKHRKTLDNYSLGRNTEDDSEFLDFVIKHNLQDKGLYEVRKAFDNAK